MELLAALRKHRLIRLYVQLADGPGDMVGLRVVGRFDERGEAMSCVRHETPADFDAATEMMLAQMVAEVVQALAKRA